MPTMAVHEVLQELDKIKVRVVVQQDKLKYSPRDVMDARPDLKARLVALKKDVISFLTGGDTINGDTIHPGKKGRDGTGGGGDTIRSGDTIPRPAIGHSASQKEWNPEATTLVQWFLDEGQHHLPTESFEFTPWIRVIDPEHFKEALLFDISMGPSGPRNQFGALTADLKRLKELFGEETTNQENVT